MGAHLLPVQTNAHDIAAFLAPDGVHHPLDRRLARHIYRANRCGHLDAGICPHTTFSALGCFLEDLTGLPHTDIEQVALVEAVGEHLHAFWQERAHTDHRDAQVHPCRSVSTTAFRLIELPRA
jgi:hypothetical protein